MAQTFGGPFETKKVYQSGGSGDMLKSVYDPANGARQVAFADQIPASTDNLTQGATNLYNQTHTGDVTGATVLTIDPTAISGKALKSPVAGTEELLINDAGTLKKTTAQAIANLAGGNAPILKVVTTGDESNSTTTASVMTGLTYTLPVGRYRLDYIINQTTNHTTGNRYNIEFTGTATGKYFVFAPTTNTTTQSWNVRTIGTEIPLSYVSFVGDTVSFFIGVEIDVIVAGDIRFTYRPVVSGTTTIRGDGTNILISKA